MGHPSSLDWRKQLPTLSGSLVEVREVAPCDAATLFELLTDGRVARHISAPPPSVAAFEGFIAWALHERCLGNSVCFGIVPHGLHRAVGIIQVRALVPSFFVAEWGFALGFAFWSTGVFPEAASLVARFAFETLGAHRLEGRVASNNARGNGALSKIGGTAEAILSRAFKRDHDYDEQLLWSLVADDWQDLENQAHERFLLSTSKEKIWQAIIEVKDSERARQKDALTSRPTLHPFFITDPQKKPSS